MPSTPFTIALGWVLSLACLGFFAYWSMALWFIHLANRAMPRVRAGMEVDEPGGGWPRVSLIVPAHNEEQFIDHALTTLRQSRYPALEIIVAADRCTDRTVEIVGRHVAESRTCATARGWPTPGLGGGAIKLVEIDRCPDGWSGKCHASWRGAREATGDWLLFTDADTTFDPDLVRAAMGLAIAHRLDFLSLLGTLTSARSFERTAQPVAAMALMKMYPIHRANRNDRPGRRPFANGQFMLFRRAVYEAVGTHEKIRNAILEDLRFARRLDFLGHRIGLVLADDLFHVRMYETPAEFERGWKRIFTEAANRNIPRLRANLWRLRWLAAAPLIQAGALLVGVLMIGPNAPLAWSLLTLATISLGTQLFALGKAYRMQGISPAAIWRFPIGCLHVANVFKQAIADLKHDRGIQWASLHYPVKSETE